MAGAAGSQVLYQNNNWYTKKEQIHFNFDGLIENYSIYDMNVSFFVIFHGNCLVVRGSILIFISKLPLPPVIVGYAFRLHDRIGVLYVSIGISVIILEC